jgi:hypothetical protein
MLTILKAYATVLSSCDSRRDWNKGKTITSFFFFFFFLKKNIYIYIYIYIFSGLSDWNNETKAEMPFCEVRGKSLE